jgi:hypothetical protein
MLMKKLFFSIFLQVLLGHIKVFFHEVNEVFPAIYEQDGNICV